MLFSPAEEKVSVGFKPIKFVTNNNVVVTNCLLTHVLILGHETLNEAEWLLQYRSMTYVHGFTDNHFGVYITGHTSYFHFIY